MAQNGSDKAKSREATDMKRLIRLALSSPLADGNIFELDGITPLAYYKKRNTDVQTRIIISQAAEAMKGDRQSAEFLMKYGGFEPPKEQNISVEVPTFLDDITIRAKKEKEEDEDEENRFKRCR